MEHESARIACDRLLVWRDPVARSGPENMAIDEVLLDTLGGRPVLRIYDWEGGWISLGYFQLLCEARRLFPDPGLHFVRRMTGGGIVDHRKDLTYTLAVPRGNPLAEIRGDASYRIIHQALVAALESTGIPACLLSEDDQADSAACFEKGVAWDVVGRDGNKLAGAGQKRNRAGLLHQGSVLASGLKKEFTAVLSERLAGNAVAWEPETGLLGQARALAATRYAKREWLQRR